MPERYRVRLRGVAKPSGVALRVLLGGALLLGEFAQEATARVGAAYGGIIRVAVSERPSQAVLEPLGWPFAADERVVARQIHGHLVRIRDGRVEPDLASDVKVSGRRIDLVLDARLRFSDGSPLLPDDVRASLEAVARHPSYAWTLDPVAGFAEFASGSSPHLAGIAVTSAPGISVTLDRDDPSFIWRLALPWMAIVRRGGRDSGPAPVIATSGPFVLGADGTTLIPFVRHARGRPYLDGVEYVITAARDHVLRVGLGDLDVARADPVQLAAESAAARLGVLTSTAATTVVLALRPGSGAPIDAGRAVELRGILDRRSLVDVLLGGQGVVASTLLPPSILPLPEPPHDSANPGEKTPLPRTAARMPPLSIFFSPDFSVPQSVVDRVAVNLLQAGIPSLGRARGGADEQSPPPGLAIEEWVPPTLEPELALLALKMAGDYRSRGAAAGRPPAWADWPHATDQAGAALAILRLDVQLQDEALLVPLYHPVTAYAMAKELIGVALDPVEQVPLLENAWLQREPVRKERRGP
ncbi:MAG: hypothetical protein HYV63_01620 [Candidatus Schekmanbacteria bacterium]|nr:hypothetical protein [Candidatus Schekmanbacteria bacterium]